MHCKGKDNDKQPKPSYVSKWMDGCTDRWMDGQIDGWMDNPMDIDVKD